MPKHKRKTVVVSEPYPKKNTQQQPSKDQGEQQSSVDQSTVTQSIIQSNSKESTL